MGMLGWEILVGEETWMELRLYFEDPVSTTPSCFTP